MLINTLEFVEQSLEIHDKIRASDLPRVQEVLFSNGGDIEYRLIGGRDSRSKFYLQLELRGTLGLMCQRCLNGLDYPFEIVRRFELVKDESDIPDSDLDDDDVDYLVIEPRLNVTDLVEEEVLLALPMSLRHENGCSSGDDAPKERKPNPFQVLEGLKTGNKS